MGMSSMMGGAIGFGWLAMSVAVVLVIGGVVILVKLLTPTNSGTGAGNIILTVLAVIGGLALVSVLAMGTMHFSMMR